MVIGLEHYLTVAGVLFTLGILGLFLNRKNVIVILMCVELMLLAVNINLVSFSVYQGNVVGQVAKVIGDHGGVIECESVPKRTVFRVLLPLQDKPRRGR